MRLKTKLLKADIKNLDCFNVEMEVQDVIKQIIRLIDDIEPVTLISIISACELTFYFNKDLITAIKSRTDT